MLKRKRENEEISRQAQPLVKRNRVLGRNHFLDLSDELVLRSLSFLPGLELLRVERVCRRFQKLASDNELWREAFYIRFVRPRARRIPGLISLSEAERENHALYYASKTARWLEHNAFSTNSASCDWKRRFKIKMNWTKGRCKVRDVMLDCPPQPRTLVRICQGQIYTADECKLRLYSQRSRPHILSTHYWANEQLPTAMSVESTSNKVYVTIGFEDGSLRILEKHSDGSFTHKADHNYANVGIITSISTAWPYILTMTTKHQLSLIEVIEKSPDRQLTLATLANLRSDAMVLPVSLSLRKASNLLVASIAYSTTRLNTGWCLGLQEIRMGLAGHIMGSRLTSTVDTPMKDFPFRKGKISSRSASTIPFILHPSLMSPPTSLSHSGCYILAGLPDNTLMVYSVISNDAKLEITAGTRLFGHTSSVSGAAVSNRGKALSISAKGDEIRVWELEDLLNSWSAHPPSLILRPQRNLDDIDVALAKRGSAVSLALKDLKDELGLNQCHWVGFDDEQVVVLGEQTQRPVLSCYDFA